jgi:hypothetical protein
MKIVDVVIWVALVTVTGFALVGFSVVVGKVLDGNKRCGLVHASTGECLDGRYQSESNI